VGFARCGRMFETRARPLPRDFTNCKRLDYAEVVSRNVARDGKSLKAADVRVLTGREERVALGEIAGLTGAHIFGLFEGIPERFKSPLGNTTDEALYFVERLRLWKWLFAKHA
jgi:hypothetical protein